MSVSQPLKKAKMSLKQICTHSGSFHADEALAVYMLRLLPQWKDSKIVRSRNPEDWEASDIVVDVGGKYDNGVKFFDHHQRGFSETFNDKYKTKLSSAGLVYKHFGKEIIKELGPGLNEDQVELLYDRVYSQFIESLDANDNGIDQFDTDVEPRFSAKAITLPSIISRFNPEWNKESSDETYYNQFLKASGYIGTVFFDLVSGYINSWLPAKSLVIDAVKNRFNIDASGKIIELAEFCPWKEHLFQVEREMNIENTIEFVIFPDTSGSYRVSTVPITSTSFDFRKGLPEPLRGLRDEELSEKSGLSGCVFIHAAGFIGGAKPRDSAIGLAKMSL